MRSVRRKSVKFCCIICIILTKLCWFKRWQPDRFDVIKNCLSKAFKTVQTLLSLGTFMPLPLIGGALSVAFVWRLISVCLTSVCLSVAYIGPKLRTERPKTKIGTEVAHVTRPWLGHHLQGQRSRSPGRFVWLFKSTWFMSTRTVSTPLPRASRCLSIMNIHGARRAGCRRRKACMGWSWAAACGAQGRGILRGFPHSLFELQYMLRMSLISRNEYSAMSKLTKMWKVCVHCSFAHLKSAWKKNGAVMFAYKNFLVISRRDAMRKRGLCFGPVSARLSVCLSVRPSVCLSVCHVREFYPDGWRYRQTSLSAR